MKKLTTYKVDWLAFSLKFEEDKTGFDENILTMLGYDFSKFDEIPGRFFYNSGATLGNRINIFWNADNKEKHKNSSHTMTVVFTGQGCSDLAEKWKNNWTDIFQEIMQFGNTNFTRIDLALDDFDALVDFNKIEKKLEKGHYRSSKRSYNIVKTSDSEGRSLGQTIYIGNARASSGSRGNVYARFYDKKAQSDSKKELYPNWLESHWEETGKKVWQRFEISFSKKFAFTVIEKFIADESIDKIFKTSLRDLLEILTPRKSEKNKSRWAKTKWWEDFLEFDEKIDFGKQDLNIELGELLNWLQVAVLPSLSLLEKIGLERDFDIYELLKKAKKPNEFSKKQSRLYSKSFDVSDDDLARYLYEFLGGDTNVKDI